MIEASAPAKIILFGEHAVVYGQPAIAVPVSSLRARASVSPAVESGSGLRIFAADLNRTLPINVESARVDDTLSLTARLVLEKLRPPLANFTITLQSDIPMASGLGSGAAVSAALARALSAALGTPLGDEALNELVYEVEKMHHGTPSGIDNTVIVYEQPIYFRRGLPIERIRIGSPFTLLIADTGQGALTKIAVGAVRDLFNANPEAIQPTLDAIGALVRNACDAIASGDISALGPLMLQNHELLQRLTVSSSELDTLVEAAVGAGALGAKLSGGGRGGNMIALVTSATRESVRDALLSAGAVRIFETTVEEKT
jgi:mevalonate kinase